MMFGLLAAISLIFIGVYYNPYRYPFEINLENRLRVALKSSLPIAIVLAISIGRLAKHRFFTPNDIDGSGMTQASSQAKILQSIIQNTLEQSILAFITYLTWCLLMPGNCLSVVPMASITFTIGRILFILGYEYGAPARALGFTLSFYVTNGMLLYIVISCFKWLFNITNQINLFLMWFTNNVWAYFLFFFLHLSNNFVSLLNKKYFILVKLVLNINTVVLYPNSIK